ncbi:MAG: hypothetical protein OXC27_09375 [Caldilineaceae bacterium]|nr:hypothetical protein [Caldilineaceae bacterium]
MRRKLMRGLLGIQKIQRDPSKKFLKKRSRWAAVVLWMFAFFFTATMAATMLPIFEPLEYDPTPTWPVLPASHPMATPTHYPMLPPTAEPTTDTDG